MFVSAAVPTEAAARRGAERRLLLLRYVRSRARVAARPGAAAGAAVGAQPARRDHGVDERN